MHGRPLAVSSNEEVDAEISSMIGGEEPGLVDDLYGELSGGSDDKGSGGLAGVGLGVSSLSDVSKTGLQRGGKEGERLSSSGSGLAEEGKIKESVRLSLDPANNKKVKSSP